MLELIRGWLHNTTKRFGKRYPFSPLGSISSIQVFPLLIDATL